MNSIALMWGCTFKGDDSDIDASKGELPHMENHRLIGFVTTVENLHFDNADEGMWLIVFFRRSET